MATKRMNKKKSIKRRSVKKSMRKNNTRKPKLFRGGKCGCSGGEANPPEIKMVGGYGPASFQPIPLRAFYDYNSNIVPNPIDDHNTPMKPSTPILMGGKKSRKNKKIIIMHGGNIVPQILSQDPILGNTNNALQYANTTPGAFTGQSLLNGQGYSYASITDGPLLYPKSTDII